MGGRRIGRRVVAVLWAASLAVVAANADKAAKDRGWDSFLSNALDTVMPGALQFVSQPWVFWLALFVSGVGIGVWFDAVPLKRLDARYPSNEAKLRELGADAIGIAQHIERARRPGFRLTPIMPILAEVLALMLRLEKAGIAVPGVAENTDVEQKLAIADRYLNVVGRLLRDGQFDEARETASRMKEDTQ